MTKDELINTLEIAKAEVEWEQPLTYATAIDEAIKCIKAFDKACEYLALLNNFITELDDDKINQPKEAWKEYIMKGLEKDDTI